ncbi:hypothetical protein MP228_001634 [Amoeboaphelidium protococcarum]|nr:hypothetical protein MP228_001634 [Amoeboaphelidium protococcarum]
MRVFGQQVNNRDHLEDFEDEEIASYERIAGENEPLLPLQNQNIDQSLTSNKYKKAKKCFVISLSVILAIMMMLALAGAFLYSYYLPRLIQEKMSEASNPRVRNVSIISITDDGFSAETSLQLRMDDPNLKYVNPQIEIGKASWNVEYLQASNMELNQQMMNVLIPNMNFIAMDPLNLTLQLTASDINSALLNQMLMLPQADGIKSDMVQLSGSPRVSLFDSRVSWKSIDLETIYSIDQSGMDFDIEDLNLRVEMPEKLSWLKLFQSRPKSPLKVTFDLPVDLHFDQLAYLECDLLYEAVQIGNISVSDIKISGMLNNTVSTLLELDLTNAEAEKKIGLLAYRYYQNQEVAVTIQNIVVKSTSSRKAVKWIDEILKGVSFNVSLPKQDSSVTLF